MQLIGFEHRPKVSNLIRRISAPLFNLSNRFIFRKKLYCTAFTKGSFLQVLSDGKVACACTQHFIIGDLNKESISSIWNGSWPEKIRKSLFNRQLPSHSCFLCRSLRSMDKQIDLEKKPQFPSEMMLEIISLCNIACLTCFQRENTALRKNKIMEDAMVYRILDEVCSREEFRALRFLGWGEPFLHPHSIDFIKYARNKNPKIFLGISTNGILLDTEEKRRKVLESGLDRIAFSIQGATGKSYSIYCRGGDFDKAINNLRETVKLKKTLGLNKPEIKWNYVLFTWNDSEEEINKAIKIGNDIGIDSIFFARTRNPWIGCSRNWPTMIYNKVDGKLQRVS